MRHLAIAWLSLGSTAFAQSSVHFEKIVRYREVVSGQTIEVAILQKPYDFSGCKLTGGENTGEIAKLDGVEVAGTDGGASYLVSLVLRKDGKHKQYECGYCESGLRPFPYEIEEPVGVDEQGRTIIKPFTWLEPKAGHDGRGQPATLPESK